MIVLQGNAHAHYQWYLVMAVVRGVTGFKFGVKKTANISKTLIESLSRDLKIVVLHLNTSRSTELR